MEFHKDQRTGEIVTISIGSMPDRRRGVWILVEDILMREDVIKAEYASDPSFVKSFADDILLILRDLNGAPTKIRGTVTVHGKDIELEQIPLPPDAPVWTGF